jgi:hypothetical protein
MANASTAHMMVIAKTVTSGGAVNKNISEIANPKIDSPALMNFNRLILF